MTTIEAPAAVQTSAAAEAEAEGLLDDIIKRSKVATNEMEKVRTRDLIGELAEQVLAGEVTVSDDLSASIDACIAGLDALLSEQLNEIMHQPEFQKLEASWRGLHYLVMESETSVRLKIKVMNLTKQELLKDFRRASRFDQNTLFKRVYEEEYGTFGGAPYAALFGDYEFGRHPEDFEILEHLSHTAAAAHSPFISAVSPAFFGLESYTDIEKVRDIEKIFDTAEYAKWHALRDSDDSRYIGLTTLRALGRLPYGAKTAPVEAFNYEEDVDGTDHNKYLWTSSVYAYGRNLTNAAARHGWLAAIRGVEGGGMVAGLPTHTFGTREGEVALKCPFEIAITDRREKALSDLGFLVPVHCKGTDYGAFFGGQSIQRAKTYSTDAANANARLSTQLPFIFAVSRIAHYMKVMVRDKVGSFVSRQGAQSYLGNWLNTYTLKDDTASQEAKAQCPLREASVDVVDVPGEPGRYRAVAFIRPHYQLEGLSISLRLVAELPQSVR